MLKEVMRALRIDFVSKELKSGPRALEQRAAIGIV